MELVVEAFALAVVVAVVVVVVRLSPRRRMQRTAQGLADERARALVPTGASRHHHRR